MDYNLMKVKCEPVVASDGSAGSFKKEAGGRLPSFKPPRDLSLGGTVPSPALSLKNLITPMNKINKKVYAPNVNVIRKKNVSSDNSTSNHKLQEDLKPVKPNLNNRRNQARHKPNVVQTQGVFSEGLAPGKVPSYSNSHVYNTAPQHVDKPKLNLNTKISNKVEDKKMKDLLNDSFIDDPKNIPDLSYVPYTLPRVYNVKSETSEPMDIDKTFESFQIKTEKYENVKKEDRDSYNKEILDVFERTTQPKLLVFEFPSVNNVKEEPQPEKIKHNNKPSQQTSVEPESKVCEGIFSGLNEGLWATLKVHADGTCYFVVGDRKIPMTLTRHRTRQEVMSVSLDKTNGKGDIINIGTVHSAFTCSTDLTKNDIVNI